jgi:hypothetical protein
MLDFLSDSPRVQGIAAICITVLALALAFLFQEDCGAMIRSLGSP